MTSNPYIVTNWNTLIKQLLHHPSIDFNLETLLWVFHFLRCPIFIIAHVKRSIYAWSTVSITWYQTAPPPGHPHHSDSLPIPTTWSSRNPYHDHTGSTRAGLTLRIPVWFLSPSTLNHLRQHRHTWSWIQSHHQWPQSQLSHLNLTSKVLAQPWATTTAGEKTRKLEAPLPLGLL